MNISPQLLTTVGQGFNAAMQQGLDSSAPIFWQKVAMRVLSTTALNNYGWLKDFPGLREWVGQRVVNNLEAQAYQIHNKQFEHTVSVKETDITDDQLGIYTPLFQMQGEAVKRHPDTLVFSALKAGFSTLGYDGKNFFATDHIGYTDAGVESAYSNYQSGSGEPWFLMDLSRSYMKPLILQERQKPRFVRLDRPTDGEVFMNGMYYYGVDVRYGAGFGFFQLAYASKADLNETNFKAARLAMESQNRVDGTTLGITATHLVYGASRQSEAEALINAQLINGGDSNVLFKAVDLMKIPYLR